MLQLIQSMWQRRIADSLQNHEIFAMPPDKKSLKIVKSWYRLSRKQTSAQQ
jgi:hypothetical protein